MIDKSFVDTNVLIYFFSPGSEKHVAAKELLTSQTTSTPYVISTQVVGEFVNVCLKRSLLTPAELTGILDIFADTFEIIRPGVTTFREALQIKVRYGYSWWDSVIIACAIEAECTVLVTEDLHSGQIINDSIRIVNPFVSA